MDSKKYSVRLYERAYSDLDAIFAYIADSLLEPGAALKLVAELEQAILSLEDFPKRGAARRVGAYADGRYRQLLVKNYVIVYRVVEETKEVYVVTVRYTPSDF